ncbi:hypothetical protein Q4540_19905 [Pseudoalteromonas carrageenovora]|uniref:hypothetical protein n=1 Tax=Pseudoalteromonas carrageenovora TaxID=227 RepID=UPI0026E1FA13|nr:hypothetical protein [Pseudoalteromonas carrageenovora]MDO6635464.1 hypothetical protein [Pseudoalteromonas carrageenovora]MDO6650742.1 hypothetical protein [Pseudoalteromonas carrageenovora]
MDEKFSLEQMKSSSFENLQSLLRDLKVELEARIELALTKITHPKFIKNTGAIDSVYVNDKLRREAYLNECEIIVSELNVLGHNLQPLDLDSDINFENTSASWAMLNNQGEACGLDIEFFPKEVNVLWVVSPST